MAPAPPRDMRSHQTSEGASSDFLFLQDVNTLASVGKVGLRPSVSFDGGEGAAWNRGASDQATVPALLDEHIATGRSCHQLLRCLCPILKLRGAEERRHRVFGV